MAKLSLNDVVSGYKSKEAINANNDLIEAAVENTLSRDGTSPNNMAANLDMDSNRIINLPDGVDDSEPFTVRQAAALILSGGGGVSDHGALFGLGDDDHTQYHNNTRGDARYYLQSQVDALLAALAFSDLDGVALASQGGVEIVASLPTLPNASYPVGSVVFLTSDGKLYRNVANVWTTAVASVDISGAISSAQGGIEIVGSLPTLPNASYPQGALVFLTTDGKLYRNTNGSSWSAAVSTSDLTGTIDLGTQISGTLTSAFAEAGLINSNVTINADGTLSGAGGGQASLTSLPGQVQVGSIAANAVTTGTLAALSVTAAKIATATITATQIAAATITATQIASNAITTDKLNAGAVTAAKIAANTITAGQIAAGTITATQIASNAVTADKILAGTITAAKMASTLTWTQNMEISTAGKIWSGTSTYNSGTGWNLEYNSGTPRFFIGNATTGKKLTWDGTDLTINGLVQWAEFQTFTPGWTGFSSAPSGTVSYLDLGTHAIIFFHASRVGTSNSASFTMTGIPAAIRPSTTVSCGGIRGQNANFGVMLGCDIDTGGVATFGCYGYYSAVLYDKIFAGSGNFHNLQSKGVLSGSFFYYPL